MLKNYIGITKTTKPLYFIDKSKLFHYSFRGECVVCTSLKFHTTADTNHTGMWFLWIFYCHPRTLHSHFLHAISKIISFIGAGAFDHSITNGSANIFNENPARELVAPQREMYIHSKWYFLCAFVYLRNITWLGGMKKVQTKFIYKSTLSSLMWCLRCSMDTRVGKLWWLCRNQ